VRERKVDVADRRLIISALSLFISSSVARHHPERSFAVVHPLLREGMTRAQWRTGNIPVVPYPAAGVDLITFQDFTGRHALVEVLLEPAKGSGLVRKTFQAELRLEPTHRWAISSWVPEGVSDSQYADNASTESASVVAAAANPPHLSSKWIFLPLGALLAGLLLTPAIVFIAQAIANRRAELEDAARRRASG
jgi:sensor c-di-GMP phosphodiesterase-like protein